MDNGPETTEMLEEFSSLTMLKDVKDNINKYSNN